MSYRPAFGSAFPFPPAGSFQSSCEAQETSQASWTAGNWNLSSSRRSLRFTFRPLTSRMEAAEARPRPLALSQEFRLKFDLGATAQLGDDTDEIVSCYTT